MNMVKKPTFALLILLTIGISSASSVFSPKDTPQFLPRIQAESSRFKEIYRPARIHIEVNSISPDMDDLLEDLEDSAYKASEIVSQFLFVKPQAQPLRLGEKNSCDGIKLENYMILGGIEADLVAFFTINDNSNQNSTSFKVCEVSNENQLISIEIMVDRKVYQGLNEDKKVSLLSKGIINAIFNGESSKLVKELEESLEEKPILKDCVAPCATCVAGNDAQCATCVNGYWLSGTDCLPCSPQCSACNTNADTCTACVDTIHMSAAPACACPTNGALSGTTCTCNADYYFSSNTVCAQCSPQCATCTLSNTNCAACVDTTHMTAAPNCQCPQFSALSGTACVCNTGYYFSADTTCSACNTNCASCLTTAGNCVTCTDVNHMTAAPACACPTSSTLTGGFCVCNPGYYYTSATVCAACNPQCAACTVDANVCSACTDTVHSTGAPNCYCPANSALAAGACVCNNGFYFSLNTVCTACQTNCATCSSGTACLTCVDTTHMSAAPACACPANSSQQGNTCVCNTGYYYSNANTCSPCQGNCATCNTSPTVCDTCTDSVHMATPACLCPATSTIVAGLCVCNAGYYFSSSTTCSACNTNCATCTTSAAACATCIDTTHMSAAPTCACPTNSNFAANTCSCNAGYYYSSNTVCSACAVNCGTCLNTQGNCLTCIDTTHMSAAPTCACPSNSILNANTCTCTAGYFYAAATPTVCTACNNNCATCSGTAATCITCSDTTHMTAAPACACPANAAVGAGNQCVCNTGYYFSANGQCSACSPQCSACSISDSTCSACIDTVHMGAPPTCSCPVLSVLTAGTCACQTGYYFSTNTLCSVCSPQCVSCSTTSANCGSCVDTTHMTAAPACACPTNGSLVGNICACNAGFYYSSNTVCSACNTNCATCDSNPNTCDTCIDPTHMSVAPACACPTNSQLTAGACTCNTGFYYSSTTTCSACQTNCATCATSAANCVTCIDSINMSAAPACACPALSTQVGNACVCNTGYYFSAAGVCSPCNNNCAGCTTTAANCNACVDTTHMTAAPACACPTNASQTGNACTCNPGYYYSDATTCSACQTNCATCDTNPNTCDTCIDPVHMSAVPACQCPAQSTLTTGACVCTPGYYYSSATVCSQCAGQCVTCSQSSTNCGSCVDTTHMSTAPGCNCPAQATLVGTTCTCNDGYYYSTNTVCSQCNGNCATCVNINNNCLTCSDTTHMTAAPACACPAFSTLTNGQCVCNDGYYYSSNSVCSPCAGQCQTCSAQTTCTACTDSVHSNGIPTCACPTSSTFTNNQCVCNTGYFYNTPTTCSNCATNCQSCVNSALNCVTCIDSVHMNPAPQCYCPAQSTLQGTTCVCNNGYFYSSNTVCAACSSNCATCQTTLTNCLTCIDTTHMSTAPACACPSNSVLTGTSCVCSPGYYYSSATTCSACSAQCATCAASSTACSTCVDTTHMSAAPTCACPTSSTLTGGSCVCNPGYFYSSNTVCSACSSQCSTCTTSSTNCLTCVDNTHMTPAPACTCPQYSTLTTGSCICNNGYYYSANTVCSPCTAPCSNCINQATYCTACLDPTHQTLAGGVCTCSDPNASFSTSSNTCVCNNGYYYNSSFGKCVLCSTGCAICAGATSCSSCYDPTHTINNNNGSCSCIDRNAVFNTSKNVCQCAPGYYQGTNSCTACGAGCQTCTSPTNCQTCFDQAHTTISTSGACSCDDPDARFDNTQKLCVCDDGFWNSGGACINCPATCQKCVSSTSCSVCFDPTHTIITAGVCVCSSPNAVFNSQAQVCGCQNGYYLNGNSCSSCGGGCSACGDPLHCNSCYDAQNAAVVNGVCKCNDKNASIFPGAVSCSCNPGYYSSLTNVCTACDAGCSQCSGQNDCKICFDQNNMSLNADGSCTCIDPLKVFSTSEEMCVCMTGYYNLDASNICHTCDVTCAACSAQNICNTCQDAAAMNNNGDGTCVCAKGKFNTNTKMCESKSSGSMDLIFAWIWVLVIGWISMN